MEVGSPTERLDEDVFFGHVAGGVHFPNQAMVECELGETLVAEPIDAAIADVGNKRTFGKKDEAANYQKMKETLKQAMEQNFRPEFLNRVDDIVVFHALSEEQLKQNLGAVGWKLSAEQIARLDAASTVPLAYPYWHQRSTFIDRNPPAV